MGVVTGILATVGLLALFSYLLPQLFVSLLAPPQNLKKKYNAKWALVTGCSSGIGKAIAQRLAAQQLNVVLVSLPDDLLDTTFEEFQQKYPSCEFRKVGAVLGEGDYLGPIVDATKDIDVQIVFNNAGYLLTGFFHKSKLDSLMKNFRCNAQAGVEITHVFLDRMISKGLRGCFVYTSSAAAYMPGPFAAMYASTKAFISTFAASIAGEVKANGIDVMSVHPSPVRSNFYDNVAHKIDLMEFFKVFAVPPEKLPDEIFRSIGLSVWRDLGGVAVGFRALGRLVDFNAMMLVLCSIAHTLPDYKRHKGD